MILKILLMAAAVSLGLLVLLFLLQGKLIYFPTRQLYRTPENAGWAYEDVVVPVGRQTTHGWWIPHPDGTQNTVLFSHGNAGNIADRIESCSIFRGLGLNVLVYDYGGYGRSTGRPSERRCYEDIRAMWNWLVEEREIAPERIVLFGRSLGAGPASQLATEVTPAAIILESAFASVPDMARTIYPVFPVGLLARHRFDNVSKAPKFTAPVLIIHSEGDTIIPYAQGRKVYEAARAPKAFVDIDGDHNDGFVVTGERYVQALREFIGPLLE
jgi:uncharacterized protein